MTVDGARHAEFLERLATLVAEFRAGIFYSTDDDGLHIEIDNQPVFIGWLQDFEQGANALRAAAAAAAENDTERT